MTEVITTNSLVWSFVEIFLNRLKPAECGWQTSGAANRALQAAAQAGFDRLADCARLRLPCLVLAGAADRHICAAASQATAQALPQATWHCYADTAHLFPWEKPEAVLADIDRWLNEYHFNPDHVGNPDYVG